MCGHCTENHTCIASIKICAYVCFERIIRGMHICKCVWEWGGGSSIKKLTLSVCKSQTMYGWEGLVERFGAFHVAGCAHVDQVSLI